MSETSFYNWSVVLDAAKSEIVKQPTITKTELAKKLGIPRKTFTDAMGREYRVEEVVDLLSVNLHNNTYDYDLLRLRGSFVLLGDLEIPFQNTGLLTKAIKIAEVFGINNLLIGGDFLCLDSVSTWSKGSIERVPTLTQEIKDARNILKLLSRQFTNIYMIMGNHEERIVRATGGSMNMKLIVDLIAPENTNIVPSDYYWCYVNDDFYVCHPENYSTNPRTVALKVAHKEHRHVVSFHQHHMSWSKDESGNFHLIDAGHCTLPNARYYKTIKANTHPQWVSGFVVLQQGKNGITHPYLFPEDSTNWDFWFAMNK